MRVISTLATSAMAAAVVLTPVLLGGCFVSVREVPKDESANPDLSLNDSERQQLPTSPLPQARRCQDGSQAAAGEQCFEDDDFRWRTSCQAASCRQLTVYLHYMLTTELGDERVAHIEAFDNAYFQGSPRASVQVAQFRARTGEWEEATVYLEPGEYYLRAYLTTGDREPTPYPLGDMQLVAGEPLGVFGALSGAEMVRIPASGQGEVEPLHIKLNRLLQRPGDEPDTHASLRITLKTAVAAETIPDRRSVRIALLADEDLEATPVRSFAMSSAELLVQGRVGEAEFTTPSLPEGDYVVLVYLDANGNEAYDAGELAQVTTDNGHIATVEVKKDRRARLELVLTAESIAH